ncbi:MAG: RelA/SpoT family protein [Candidatus Onthomorpha sp.]|nr:bifunctional (p)ppGpp synthetase/guanosine-3',5'-bis(diphosphate) 3'-pyrophosphohydrolase [Bacteroidales bacterium]MDY4583738.1 RelA/SpoT family protein [Candidatus Onthomorpha sp.]MCI6800065.1 RelA/SpoT family protein [Bacteroidales bacterium]MCI7662192.1 RelA/SpoT family protein [Bacteroidales bacterium]MDD7540312.1 RelA/SpoT family protein [Bacteroidales bacterium]
MYVIDEQAERKEILRRYKHIIRIVSNNVTNEGKRQIRKAFTVAMNAHAGVRRKTGEPYIYHPLEVATIAAEDLGLGATAVVCAFLHDVVEDTEYTLEDIEHIFDKKVAQIVDGLTKIEGVFDYANNSIQSENFKKLLTAMGNDMRVILIKLCDRLHNMRTLESMPENKQLKIASETQQLYVPLAHRLGLYKIKSELEDLATKYINPKAYNDIASRLKDTEEQRNEFITEFAKPIKQKLTERGFKFTLSGRVKSITSIIGKIENKGVKFEDIYDIFAIRIILDVPQSVEKEACFSVYSIISSMYNQKLNRFRDWLTNPKSNGYEALHCTVMSEQGQWVEVQIRSQRMDEVAEKGLAAHYKYKEVKEGELDENLDNWLSQIRELLDNDTSTAVDFVNDFKLDVVTDRIIVFTPKGKSVNLPVGASVLDFAYNVHTELGNHCMGAKVNYKVVPIEHILHPSDQVEIITSKIIHPKEEWLKLVKTSKASSEIKKYIREYRTGYMSAGQTKLRELFLSLGIEYSENNIDKLRQYCKQSNLTDFFFLVYNDTIGEQKVRQCFAKPEKNSTWLLLRNPFTPRKKQKSEKTLKEEITEQVKNNPEMVLMKKDAEKLPYKTASCCNPIPGDDIVGLIRDNCIEVHRTNCKHAIDEMSKYGNRIIKAKWRENEKITFLAGIKLVGIDRKGLLQEITSVISEVWNINIRGLVMESSEGIFEGSLMVYISDAENLNKLIDNIKAIDGIEKVVRI